MFVAMFNIPGYLPEMEPATFDTAREGWEFLAEERMRADIAWTPDNEDDPDGPAHIDAAQVAIEENARQDRTGTVYGGDADPYAYSVDYAHDGFGAGAL